MKVHIQFFSCGKFDLCSSATFSTVHVKLMIQLSTTGFGLTILEESSILINRLIPPWQQHHQRKKAHKKYTKKTIPKDYLLDTFF